MESKLLDMRDCSNESFKQIYKEMLKLFLLQQPRWFQPLLLRSSYLQDILGYNNWSRAWEYPWAIMASELEERSYKILDVGGGGSPYAIYLAQNGHESYVVDPSLNMGLNATINRNKSIIRNIKSFVFYLFLKLTGIRRLWGKHSSSNKNPVSYYPYSATKINFLENHFDRVFCLSVLEHIPVELWSQCIKEFERILKPGGRLIITLDMSTFQADERLYFKLVDCCTLKLIGNPYYDVPISQSNKQNRHPGHTYETIGLIWQG